MPSIATTPEQSTPPSPSSRDRSQPPTTTTTPPPAAAVTAGEGAGEGVANPPPAAPEGPKAQDNHEEAGVQGDGDNLAPPDAPQAHTYIGEDGKLRWVQYCEEP
ncbi:hypothetical protein IAT38_000253 [Cryptococcus sp. DSM 104549]